MRFYKSLLSLFGLFLLVLGLILNVLIFALNWYPTYLFFILMAAGIIFFLIDIPIRKAKRLTLRTKILIQIAIIILPITAIYIKNEIINPRAEITIAPNDFSGPYIVIFGLQEQEKLPREHRDIIERLPQNGILLTSTEIQDMPNLSETYISDGHNKYGTMILPELGGSGEMISGDCSLKLFFRTGYIKKLNDTSSLNFDMNNFITKVHDSLCKKLSK